MGYGKKNHVSTDISKYNITLLGESKIGKTTLTYQICEKLFGENGYLFAELGMEQGADAIEGINYVNCNDWDSEYDELYNSLGFETLCRDIIDNKASEYPDLKVLVCDTYDLLIPMVERKAIALWNRENPEKKATSIKATWGGFDGPTKKVLELITTLEAELNKVGVRIWWIGHVKNKENTDAMTNETYTTLTSDVASSYYKPLQKRQHIVGMLYIDREISKEKTGRKNVVTKKEETINRIMSESRKIKFRDDGYVADVGGRFAQIVPEIDFDVDAFINAVTDAIKAEAAKSGKAYETIVNEDAKKQKVINDRVAKQEQATKEQKTREEALKEILTFLKENLDTNPDMVKSILDICKNEAGCTSSKDILNITDMTVIEKISDMIKD